MHTVAAVIDQGALTFDFAIPCEVFGLDRTDIADPWYELIVVAAGERRIRTQTGFVLEATHGLRALARADTIVVPGWADPDVPPSPQLVRALRAGHERGARLVSICTGAFVLAAAGLLDGRRAATHWMYADRLRERHPLVDVDERVLYVVDGNVMSSGGTAAGIDLCLHIVAADHRARPGRRPAGRVRHGGGAARAVRSAAADISARLPKALQQRVEIPRNHSSWGIGMPKPGSWRSRCTARSAGHCVAVAACRPKARSRSRCSRPRTRRMRTTSPGASSSTRSSTCGAGTSRSRSSRPGRTATSA